MHEGASSPESRSCQEEQASRTRRRHGQRGKAREGKGSTGRINFSTAQACANILITMNTALSFTPVIQTQSSLSTPPEHRPCVVLSRRAPRLSRSPSVSACASVQTDRKRTQQAREAAIGGQDRLPVQPWQAGAQAPRGGNGANSTKQDCVECCCMTCWAGARPLGMCVQAGLCRVLLGGRETFGNVVRDC